jgi:hypothetical protein
VYEKLGLSEAFISKMIKSHECVPFAEPRSNTETNIEIFKLLSSYDCSNIEIGVLTFNIEASDMEKSIAATFYPKRIIVATRMVNEHGSVWTMTDCLSILCPNIADEQLGVVVLRHIFLSTVKNLHGSESWDLRDKYKKLCNLKTEGQVLRNSKLVTVFLTDSDLRFELKNNRYPMVKRRHYEYQGMPDSKFTIAYPCAADWIGANLRKAWATTSIT